MFRTTIFLGAFACGGAMAVACGGNSSSGAASDAGPSTTDAGGDDAPSDAGIGEAAVDAALDAVDTGDANDAFVPELPRVQNTLGGSVLTHPRLVPIVYASDPLSAPIQQFVAKLAGSSYWAAATGEYGVGALTAGPSVVVGDAPPATISSDDIPKWIAAHLDAATGDGGTRDAGPAWPAPDGQTIYMVFYPEGTTIQQTNPYGGPPTQSCVGFGGYHDEATYSGGSTPFAVIARCSSYLGLGGIDFTTYAASHEAIEASTDPFVESSPSFDDVDFAGSGWSTAAGGPEVGDLCKLEPSSPIRPADIGFLVQRTWSDAAAKAGHDPCAPAPGGAPYFVAIPEVTGTEVYPDTYAAGIAVAPGSSVTVAVHLYSDGPTSGPWTVEASEPNAPQLPDPAQQLSFAFDRAQGQNGDVLRLTITRKAPAHGMPSFGAPFAITSRLGGTSHSYYGVVGN